MVKDMSYNQKDLEEIAGRALRAQETYTKKDVLGAFDDLE